MRKLEPIELTSSERVMLEGLARAEGSGRRKTRAEIVLAFADGLTIRQAAAKTGVSTPTALDWRRRWLAGGHKNRNLFDAEHPGNPDFKTEKNPRRGLKRISVS